MCVHVRIDVAHDLIPASMIACLLHVCSISRAPYAMPAVAPTSLLSTHSSGNTYDICLDVNRAAQQHHAHVARTAREYVQQLHSGVYHIKSEEHAWDMCVMDVVDAMDAVYGWACVDRRNEAPTLMFCLIGKPAL